MKNIIVISLVAIVGLLGIGVASADLPCSWTMNYGRVAWYSIPPGLTPKQVRFELVGGVNLASSSAKKVYLFPFKLSNDVSETMTDYGKTVNGESLEMIRSSWITGKMISVSTLNCNGPVLAPVVTQVTAGVFSPN